MKEEKGWGGGLVKEKRGGKGRKMDMGKRKEKMKRNGEGRMGGDREQNEKELEERKSQRKKRQRDGRKKEGRKTGKGRHRREGR